MIKNKIKALVLSGLLVGSTNSYSFGAEIVVDLEQMIAHAQMLTNQGKQLGIDMEQLTSLIQQLQQLKMIYDTMHSTSGGSIKQQAFNAMMSQLPPEFQSLINGSGNFGNWQSIASSNMFYDIKNAPIIQKSETVKQFEFNRELAAKHSGTFKQLVEDSDDNFQSIAKLLEKMKSDETVSEKLDTISESNIVNATLLNQVVKNQATSEAFKAESELSNQKRKELGMYQPQSATPRFAGIYSPVFNKEISTFGVSSDGTILATE